MNKRYPHVMEPLRVSGNLMRNRIILAPSTIHSANDGTLYPTEDSIAFLSRGLPPVRLWFTVPA